MDLTDARAMLDGIVWILRMGAPWHDLPDCYPLYQTCHRRFSKMAARWHMARLLHALAEELRVRGKLDLLETFIDASFSSAKKGALLSANSPRKRQQNHGDRRRPGVL